MRIDEVTLDTRIGVTEPLRYIGVQARNITFMSDLGTDNDRKYNLASFDLLFDFSTKSVQK